MSFDVEFIATSQISAAEQAKEIRAFLLHRPNYQENGESLIYRREATGVYGLWDFPALSQKGADEAPAVAVLALSFLRPGFFVRELSREISEVQRFFRLSIHDPQSGLDHLPDAGASAVLSSYMDHAGRAARVFASHQEGERVPALPRKKLDAVWEWNDSRDTLQKSLGDDIFVPTIMLARLDQDLEFVAVWTDGIAVLMPKVDTVLVHREQTAPRQGLLRRRVQAIGAMSFAAFSERFQAFSHPFDGPPGALIYGQSDAIGLRKHLETQPLDDALNFEDSSWRKRIDFLPMDSVTDEEFLLAPR